MQHVSSSVTAMVTKSDEYRRQVLTCRSPAVTLQTRKSGILPLPPMWPSYQRLNKTLETHFSLVTTACRVGKKNAKCHIFFFLPSVFRGILTFLLWSAGVIF